MRATIPDDSRPAKTRPCSVGHVRLLSLLACLCAAPVARAVDAPDPAYVKSLKTASPRRPPPPELVDVKPESYLELPLSEVAPICVEPLQRLSGSSTPRVRHLLDVVGEGEYTHIFTKGFYTDCLTHPDRSCVRFEVWAGWQPNEVLYVDSLTHELDFLGDAFEKGTKPDRPLTCDEIEERVLEWRASFYSDVEEQQQLWTALLDAPISRLKPECLPELRRRFGVKAPTLRHLLRRLAAVWGTKAEPLSKYPSFSRCMENRKHLCATYAVFGPPQDEGRGSLTVGVDLTTKRIDRIVDLLGYEYVRPTLTCRDIAKLPFLNQ